MTIRMQPELPWNVAGIAPEAREAARASARREGLSVGEWLTRRILQNLGEPELRQDAWWQEGAKEPRRLVDVPALAPDSTEMLAHVSRSEAETQSSARRIEDQLKSLARRLEQTERSQSEHGRAMTQAASEINIVSRGQAQAFDQLGAHVVRLDERLARIEQQTASDGTRDAIRALHLGLSRLADQMADTANRSAAQAAQLAGNMEALVGKLAESREENQRSWHALEERVAALAANVGSIAGKLLESREAAERSLHALSSRVDAAEQGIARLETAQGAHGADLQRHAGALVQIAESVETLTRQVAAGEAGTAQMRAKLDTTEQRHDDALAELGARLQVLADRLDAAGTSGSASSSSPAETPVEAHESLPQTQTVHGADAEAQTAQAARPVGFRLESFFAGPGTDHRPDEAAGSVRVSGGAPAATAERKTWMVLLAALAGLVAIAAAAGIILSRDPPPDTRAVSVAIHAVPPRPEKAAAGRAGPAFREGRNARAPAQSASLAPGGRLATLANAGNAEAEEMLGLEYANGEGQAVNEAEGAKWLERAARQGQAVAAWRLGAMYEHGKGVPADAAKAVQWYAAAARAGNRKAMHNLAVAYANGTGVAKDMTAAAQWFARAAALGLADSQYNLAVLYERGLGVPQNLADAYKWYAIAAAQGDAGSQQRLAEIASQLDADDKLAAEKAAAYFRPERLDRAANTPPALARVVEK